MTYYPAVQRIAKAELDDAELVTVCRRIHDEIGEYSRDLLDSVYSDPQLDV